MAMDQDESQAFGSVEDRKQSQESAQAASTTDGVGPLGALADQLYHQEPVPDFDDVLMA